MRYLVTDCPWNQANFPYLIGTILDYLPSYAVVVPVV